MSQNHKLQHTSREEQTAASQQAATNRTGLEFQSAEEAIRHDSSATELPPAIAERLRKSIADEPPPAKDSWWKKLFGR